jgi:hypothetical protein
VYGDDWWGMMDTWITRLPITAMTQAYSKQSTILLVQFQMIAEGKHKEKSLLDGYMPLMLPAVMEIIRSSPHHLTELEKIATPAIDTLKTQLMRDQTPCCVAL